MADHSLPAPAPVRSGLASGSQSPVAEISAAPSSSRRRPHWPIAAIAFAAMLTAACTSGPCPPEPCPFPGFDPNTCACRPATANGSDAAVADVTVEGGDDQ